MGPHDAERLTYLIAPEMTFHPYTGSIRLGSILADPLKPHRPLTFIEPEELEKSGKYPTIEVDTKTGVEVIRSGTKSASGAILAKFLGIAGAELSAERASESLRQYTMDELRTESFLFDPDMAVLEERVAQPKVKGHMKKLVSRHSAYMINGIKIAKGLKIDTQASANVAGSVGGSAPVPTPAGHVEVGAKVAGGQGSGRRDKSTSGQDLVISYKLLKLEYSLLGGELKTEEYQPGKAGFQGIDKQPKPSTAEKVEALTAQAAEALEIGQFSKSASISTVTLEDGTELSMVTFPPN